MKLFKNSVGRPSNEIKRKRKKFIESAIKICITLITLLLFTLATINTDKLQGAAKLNQSDVLLDFEITNAWWSGPGSKYKNFNVQIKSNKPKIDHFRVVSCTNKNDCTSNNAYDMANSTNRTGPLMDYKGNYTVKIQNGDYKNLGGNIFYVRITTYNVKFKWLAVEVYEINVKTTTRTCTAGKCYPITKTLISRKYNNEYVKTTTTKKPTTTTKKPTTTTKKPLTLSCQASRTVGNPVTCYVTSNGKAVKGAKISLPSSSIARIKNVSDNEFQVIYNDTIFDLYRDQVKFDSGNKRNYVKTVITATLNGTQATDTVNVYESTAPSSLTLNCPTSAKVNEKFLCKTNKIGVKITIGGARALDENVDSVYVTTSDDMSKSVKYTTALFNGKVVDKKYIYKDKNGTYVKAYITAEKRGFTTVKKVVKIYK